MYPRQLEIVKVGARRKEKKKEKDRLFILIDKRFSQISASQFHRELGTR